MSEGFGEPWSRDKYGSLQQSDEKPVMTRGISSYMAGSGVDAAEMTTDRIVACVNACTGITDPVDAVERARVALRTIDAMPHYTAPIPENYVASLHARYEKCLLVAAEALAALGESHEC